MNKMGENKLRTLSPVFTNRFQNNLIKINFEYFQTFINFCFYIFLVPFRISLKSGIYTAKSFIFQKIICGSISVVCIVQGILLTRGAYTAKFVNKPELLFTMWSMSHNGLFAFVWTLTFWKKQAQFIQIMNSMESAKSSLKGKGGTALLMILVITYYILYILLVTIKGSRGLPFAFGFTRFSIRAFYELLIIPERNDSMSLENLKGLGYQVKGISGAYAVVRIYGVIIIGMTCALISLSSILMSQAVQKLCHILGRDNSAHFRKQDLFEGYWAVRRLINLINGITRPFVLLLCSANVPFIARRLTATLDNGIWTFRGILCLNLTSHLIPFFLAAHLHYNGKLLKDRLLKWNKRVGERKFCGIIYRDEFGVEGMGFFTVSYGFLGSVGSACLSYIILLLQMQPPPTCDTGEDDF